MSARCTGTKFSPPGDVSARGLVRIPPRLADHVTEDCYACVCEGTCLEHEICDGDMVFATPNRTPEVGEFAMFWPRDGGKPKIKRLVTAVPPAFSPESELVPLVIVEQINPPKQYVAPADRFEAIHAVSFLFISSRSLTGTLMPSSA